MSSKLSVISRRRLPWPLSFDRRRICVLESSMKISVVAILQLRTTYAHVQEQSYGETYPHMRRMCALQKYRANPSWETIHVPSSGNPGAGRSSPSHPAHIMPTARSNAPFPGR